MLNDLNRIIASVADGIVVLDHDLRYTFVNDAAEQLFGLSRSAVIGRTPLELFAEEVIEEAVPRMRAAIASGTVLRYEGHYPIADRWYENRLYPSASGLTIFFTDITQRKKAEQALRQSEEVHRFLVSLHDATRSLLDPDDVMRTVVNHVGRHLNVSRCTYGEIDAAQEHVLVSGDFTDGVVSIAGRHRLHDFGVQLIDDLKHGATVVVPAVARDPRTSGAADAAFQAIQTQSLICVPLVKAGRFVALFMLHHVEPRAWTRDEIALVEQIGERTWFAVETAKAQGALRESRDVLSLAMRGGRMGAWSRNVITNEVWWSRELEDLFGLPPGGFEGSQTGFRAFVHPDDRDAVERIVASALASRTDYVMEFRFRHASGVYRWMEGRGRAVYADDGTARWLYGIGIDITDRKASDAANHLLVSLDDAVRTLADPEEITQTAARMLGEYLEVNRCAYATVEADEDTFELTGNYTHETHSIVGRYAFRQFGAECLRLMRAGEPCVVSNSRADDRLDAEDREAYEAAAIRAVICVPIRKAGRLVAAMAVHAVTPRLWTAGEIELVQRVANRCWESIERARVERERGHLLEAAETANRAKDEFLAMLGHELRNPLSPILTALQLMKLRGHDTSLHERTVIERQVQHLARLVDDLLDVSRIARGKVELKREVVELSEVVAHAIEVASPLLEQRTQRLAVDVPRQGLCVDGDPARLSQVLSNLVTNAAKYTPPGGEIAISASREGSDAVLRVRDTGVGIPADVLPRVFDLFMQGGQPIDRAQGGLGLGLTIVRSLTERHGGTVTAHSDGPGTGSEFVVRLPAAQSADAAERVQAAALAPAVEGSAARVRILIVDDNADAAELLAYALALTGYETFVAHDGPTALRLIETVTPDAAFLDIGLPVMDGYELATRLRSTPGLARIRLIAVTGYGQESDRKRSAAAGFDYHLVKPVSLDQITEVVAQLLAGPDHDRMPPSEARS